MQKRIAELEMENRILKKSTDIFVRKQYKKCFLHLKIQHNIP